MGTSTSSIGATEEAYRRLLPDGRYPEDLRRPIVHTPHSLGDFVRAALGLEGVAVTVATACSSSAKIFAQAERLMRLGLADAAIVGGVDSLCGSVLFGFNALGLLSPVFAGAAMALSSVSVVSNALLLKRYRLPAE
jgi:3-oxoacyl-[acyl-carrier-protein] synthase-1